MKTALWKEISGGLSMKHMSFLLFKIGKHYQSLFFKDKILHGHHSNLVKSIVHINISIFFYILNDDSTKSIGSGWITQSSRIKRRSKKKSFDAEGC